MAAPRAAAPRAVGAANATKLATWRQKISVMALPDAAQKYPFVKVQTAHKSETAKILLTADASLNVMINC